MVTQGKKKCDLVDCVTMTLEKEGIENILEKHGAGYVIHKRNIDEIAAEIHEARHHKKLKTQYENVVLRPWQAELKAIIDEQIMNKNDRCIIWIYDSEGNKGKSWFAKYQSQCMMRFCCAVMEDPQTSHMNTNTK